MPPMKGPSDTFLASFFLFADRLILGDFFCTGKNMAIFSILITQINHYIAADCIST